MADDANMTSEEIRQMLSPNSPSTTAAQANVDALAQQVQGVGNQTSKLNNTINSTIGSSAGLQQAIEELTKAVSENIGAARRTAPRGAAGSKEKADYFSGRRNAPILNQSVKEYIYSKEKTKISPDNPKGYIRSKEERVDLDRTFQLAKQNKAFYSKPMEARVTRTEGRIANTEDPIKRQKYIEDYIKLINQANQEVRTQVTHWHSVGDAVDDITHKISNWPVIKQIKEATNFILKTLDDVGERYNGIIGNNRVNEFFRPMGVSPREMLNLQNINKEYMETARLAAEIRFSQHESVKETVKFMDTMDIVNKTGQNVNTGKTTFLALGAKGMKDLNKMEKLNTSGLRLATLTKMEAKSTVEMMRRWNMELGMSEKAMGHLSLEIQNVSAATGLMGDELAAVVKQAEKYALNMRNAGTLTAEAAGQAIKLAAAGKKYGIEEMMGKMQEFGSTGGLKALENLSKGTMNPLMLQVATKGGMQQEFRSGSLFKNEEQSNKFMNLMSKEYDKISGVQGFVADEKSGRKFTGLEEFEAAKKAAIGNDSETKRLEDMQTRMNMQLNVFETSIGEVAQFNKLREEAAKPLSATFEELNKKSNALGKGFDKTASEFNINSLAFSKSLNLAKGNVKSPEAIQNIAALYQRQNPNFNLDQAKAKIGGMSENERKSFLAKNAGTELIEAAKKQKEATGITQEIPQELLDKLASSDVKVQQEGLEDSITMMDEMNLNLKKASDPSIRAADSLQAIQELLSTTLGPLSYGFKDWVTSFMPSSSTISGAGTTIKGGLEYAKNTTSNAASSVWNFAKNPLGGIKSGIGNAASGIGSAASNVGATVGNAASGAWGLGKKGFSNLGSAASDLGRWMSGSAATPTTSGASAGPPTLVPPPGTTATASKATGYSPNTPSTNTTASTQLPSSTSIETQMRKMRVSSVDGSSDKAMVDGIEGVESNTDEMLASLNQVNENLLKMNKLLEESKPESNMPMNDVAESKMNKKPRMSPNFHTWQVAKVDARPHSAVSEVII